MNIYANLLGLLGTAVNGEDTDLLTIWDWTIGTELCVRGSSY
jgi:hypothetical protein